MLWLVLLKIKLAFMALAKRRAYTSKSDTLNLVFYRLESYLSGYFFLIFFGEIDKVVVFGAD